MSVRPILPRISDPNMLPGDGSVDKAGILMNSNQPPIDEEQPGLFTTIYENKMIVIIIVLVILIIGICAYVVIRKKDVDEPQEEGPLQSKELFDTSRNIEPGPPQRPQKEHSPEELQRIMNEMREAKMRRAQQQGNQRSDALQGNQRSDAPRQQQQETAPPIQSDEELDKKFNEAAMSKDDSQERLFSRDDDPQDSIIDYMKEAARESPEDFDDKALKIIDEQASLSESVSTVCGAPTQSGGSCRLRPVVDGRCRKHIGL